MPYTEPYRTGTMSVNAGSTAVTGTSTLWQVVANLPIMPGDVLVYGEYRQTIESVTDSTHLVLEDGWPGPDNLTAVAYKIERISPRRSSVNELHSTFSDLMQGLAEMSPVWRVVEGEEPDPSTGEVGQLAFKIAGMVWKAWIKEESGWTYIGAIGFTPKGAWSSGATYAVGDYVTYSGKTYISLQASNTNHAPSGAETDTAWWMWSPTGATVDDVLDDLGIHSITISESDPSGGVDGDLWVKVAP